MSVRVLVVEQNDTLRRVYVDALFQSGFSVKGAKSIPEAAEAFAKQAATIIVLDLLLMGGGAFVFMAAVRGAFPKTRVIATTASGAMRQAANAIDEGAFDYLVKPIDAEALVRVVKNAALQADSATGAADDTPRDRSLGAIFGENLAKIYRMAQSQGAVLIDGENGTGKCQCAELLHNNSNIADQPFIAIDCQTIGDRDLGSVIEDAFPDRRGVLFLREPSQLSLVQQTQLLRFLQSGLIETKTRQSPFADVRIVCSMSSLPEDAVDAGRLREDLFYRLRVMRISLPPLRSRGEDFSDIANAVLDQEAWRAGKPHCVIAADARAVLKNVTWPENIRQLQSVMETFARSEKGEVLRANMLPETFRKENSDAKRASELDGDNFLEDSAENTVADLIRAGWSLGDLERLLIETAIRQNGGSIPKAANQLSVSPSTLYRKKDNWP